MQLEELEVHVGQGRTHRDPRSPLMIAKAKALKGQKIRVCPFCTSDKTIDEHGFCKHVIGITRDKKTYEPMVLRKGRRVIQVPMIGTGEYEQDDDGNAVEIMEPNPPPIPAGAKVCRISDCYRVYLESPPELPKGPVERLTRRPTGRLKKEESTEDQLADV